MPGCDDLWCCGVCVTAGVIHYISLQYGVIKDSGIGREGVKYAIEDFTELKVMLMKDIDQL